MEILKTKHGSVYKCPREEFEEVKEYLLKLRLNRPKKRKVKRCEGSEEKLIIGKIKEFANKSKPNHDTGR